MIYQIIYKSPNDNKEYCMFDIEYYKDHPEYCKDKWISEIRCTTIVEGLVMFVRDMIQAKENFDCATFIEDAAQLQEVRGLLFEKFDNKPRTDRESDVFHYHIFAKSLRLLLDAFCDKYGCRLNVD